MLYIRRLSQSQYQDSNSLQNEAQKLQLLGLCYLELHDESRAADIWLTNTHVDFHNWQELPRHVQNEYSQLQLIVHPNSGHDNFTLEMARLGSPVILGNRIRAQSVAEWYLGQFYFDFSFLAGQRSWSKDRKWPREKVKDKNVLIIGMGHVGSLLAEQIKNTVKSLVIVDPFIDSFDVNKGEVSLSLLKDFWRAKLPSSLPEVIFVCPSLNHTSQQLIDQNFLARCPANLHLYNASRGNLIDLEKLFLFLKEHPQARASLDVFPAEPYPIEELSQYPNLRSYSHIAGVSASLNDDITLFSYQVISDYQKLDKEEFLKKYQQELLSNKVRSSGSDGEMQFLC